MLFKGLAKVFLLIAVLLALPEAPALAWAQASGQSGSARQDAPPLSGDSQAPLRHDCNGGPCEDQQPRTIYVPAAPAPIIWTVHEQILWGACLVLVLLAYAGIMLAVSTLRKIERHTSAAETTAAAAAAAANAAADAARAALLHAQTIAKAERPWVLVTAEPTRGAENSFEITATNRGRSPATISSVFDDVVFAADDAHLPRVLESRPADAGSRFIPILLLPGESAALKTFTRDGVRALCGSDEKFSRVERWEDRVFLCGKLVYDNLLAPEGSVSHETAWCLWYIHGKQRSALVPAGGVARNAHT